MCSVNMYRERERWRNRRKERGKKRKDYEGQEMNINMVQSMWYMNEQVNDN